MAFYEENLEDQNQQDPNAPGKPVGGQSSVITGQGTQGTTTAGTGEQAAGASEGAGAAAGTPFVGINEYIAANKPQTEKLAQNISGYVGGLGDTARNAITSGQDQYNQAVTGQTVNLNQDLVNQAKTAAETLQEEQNAEFKKMRDANYTGPASLQESQYFQPINTAVTAAQKAGENTQTLEGLQKVASGYQQQSKGRINQGAAAFDAGLLSSDEQARAMLAQARTNLQDIPGMLSAAEADALSRAQAAKATNDATRNAIQSTFGGDNSVQKQLEQSLVQKAQSQIQQSKSQQDQTVAALKANAQLNDNQLQLLGLNREQYNALLGDRDYLRNTYGKSPYEDLSTYLTYTNPETQITAQNVANADEYARYAALNDLMGTSNMFLSDPSLAGQANLDTLDLNWQGASSDIQDSIALEKAAAEQAAREAAAARARQEEEDARKRAENAMLAGAGVGMAVAGPVGAVVGGAIGAVFCLNGNTPVLMADGSYKMVQDIKLGDETKFGGTVLGRGETYCDDLYEYKGVKLSANHALYEDGVFLRAKDSKHAVKLEGTSIVYPIWNENHILVSNNKTLFCDMVEYDLPGASDEEKLKALNENCVEVAEQLLKELQ